MSKLLDFPARRRADGASPPAPRRTLIAAGVIRPNGDQRPTLRLIARVDDACVRITHFPASNDAPEAA